MTTTIYRHSDGGAPKLSSQPGSLIEVLDYALLSSGWAKPFFKPDANVPYGQVGAVYQQGAGNQYFLKVDDEYNTLAPPTAGNNVFGNAAIVTGYKSMSSYTSGLSPFPFVKGYVNAVTSVDSPGDNGNFTNIYFRKASAAVLGSFPQSGSFSSTFLSGSNIITSSTPIRGVLQNGAVITNPGYPPGTIVLSFIDPVTITVSNVSTGPGTSVPTPYTQNVGFVPWTIIATNKAFYMWVGWGGTTRTQMYFFGDFDSKKAGDTNNCMLLGTRSTDISFLNIGSEFGNVFNSTSQPDTSLCIPAPTYFSYAPGAITRAKDCGVDLVNFISVGNSPNFGLSYPDPSTSHMFMSPIFILDMYEAVDGSRYKNVRGTLPGAWTTESPAFVYFSHGDTFSGTGDLAGRTFEFFNINNIGLAVIETSNTW